MQAPACIGIHEEAAMRRVLHVLPVIAALILLVACRAGDAAAIPPKASLPADAAQRAVQVLASKAPPLVRGLCATAAASCVAAGVGPLVLIGMIDAQGVAGRIGGGVVDVPATLFERALQAH